MHRRKIVCIVWNKCFEINFPKENEMTTKRYIYAVGRGERRGRGTREEFSPGVEVGSSRNKEINTKKHNSIRMKENRLLYMYFSW